MSKQTVSSTRSVLEKILRRNDRSSAVRRNHIPLWLKKRIKAYLRMINVPQSDLHYFNYFCGLTGWHPDHFGSSERGRVFVDEPYPIAYGEPHKYDDATSANIARLLGLELTIVEPSKSNWNPPHTIRYEYREPTEPATGMEMKND
jgi:hypothetical protein